MARKKTREPDKLSQEVSMAIAAGMSYGKWKATQPVADSKPQPTGTRQVCKNCGKEFLYKRKSREKVFCDDDCKKLYYKRNLVYVPLIKKCEWCGKSFEASKSNQKFCSKNCGSVASYYRRRELLKTNG